MKLRIPSQGRGKSGGFRVIVVFKKGSHCFFIYGFLKNEKDNISSTEEKALKITARELLQFSDNELYKRIQKGSLLEVNNE